jgi:phospholipid/cholesterol/gamma-HCH transport system ATP-binding protein
VHQKLSLVHLEDFKDYYPSEISGGMKKRAGLARAMALDADLLFFDEPSAGLDPISSAELDRLILDLRDRCDATMVVVTHELDSIFTIADRVIMLDKKTKGIIAEGNPRKLRRGGDDPFVKEFLSRDGMRRN